ncbi:hypothetical protein, partial [Cereibacter sphaeroides]|uniref:hypothetical protein n=1 Tax=Cereibacter sphaeroides TaxID=1063 RepID=UPI001F1EFB17
RTRTAFRFPAGPAILALDFDGAIFTREEALDYLYGMIPQLREVPIVWTPSSSSHICRQSDGEDLTGLRGQRFY